MTFVVKVKFIFIRKVVEWGKRGWGSQEKLIQKVYKKQEGRVYGNESVVLVLCKKINPKEDDKQTSVTICNTL